MRNGVQASILRSQSRFEKGLIEQLPVVLLPRHGLDEQLEQLVTAVQPRGHELDPRGLIQCGALRCGEGSIEPQLSASGKQVQGCHSYSMTEGPTTGLSRSLG